MTVRRKRRRGCAARVATAAACFGAAFAIWFWTQLQPVGAGTPRVVAIQRGMAIGQAATLLRRAGVIRHAWVFSVYARWRGEAALVRAGRYRLSPTMAPGQILDKLVRGRQDLAGLTTIPEGYTVNRIAETLVARGVIRDKASFTRLASKPGSAVRLEFAAPPTGLEGYLFPETYDFGERPSPQRVIQMMVDMFTRVFERPYRAEIASSGHTLHEIVSIASMIEREAVVERDRPMIAGVIENRLRKGMRLQIDATVLYALGQHKSRVLYSDLRTPSPYNTYMHAGLPPGPIANPGLASLLAALRPSRHDYLFYVAAPDGSHVFTRTEAEHNAAIRRVRTRNGR